jgi:hypothetical protein
VLTGALAFGVTEPFAAWNASRGPHETSPHSTFPAIVDTGSVILRGGIGGVHRGLVRSGVTQGIIEGGLQEAVASHGPSAKSFMQTSWKMFDATRVLLESRQSVAEPTGLVAGMCLELALKAYLLHSNVSEDTLRDHVSHDLFEAWHRCIAHGLPLTNPKARMG